MHIDEIDPNDITLILGMWEGLMGGGGTRQLVAQREQWIRELKRCRRTEPYIIGCRWNPNASLSLSVDHDGMVYANPETGYPIGSTAQRAAQQFAHSVMRLR